MAKSAKDVMNELARESNLLHEVTSEERAMLQKTLMEMMHDIHDVCVRHEIRYGLVGGSCLGAVRHKGFIPWDDDIDISMCRSDWEKFKTIFDEELGNKYVMEAPRYGNKDTKCTWAKVYKKGTILSEIQDENCPYEKGIFLDIFFYENVSDNPLVRKFDARVSDFMKGVATSIVYYKYPNETVKKFYAADPASNRYYKMRCFLGFLFSWVSHKTWCCWFDKFVSRHKTPGRYITIPTGRKNYLGEIQERNWWEPHKLSAFEDAEFFIPAEAHNYLVTIYGDSYMQLPPEDKREKHFCVELKFG